MYSWLESSTGLRIFTVKVINNIVITSLKYFTAASTKDSLSLSSEHLSLASLPLRALQLTYNTHWMIPILLDALDLPTHSLFQDHIK